MLNPMPAIIRDGKEINVESDLSGVFIRFHDLAKGLIFMWTLRVYPKDFVRAAQQAAEEKMVHNDFSLRPDGIYLRGGFTNLDKEDCPELHFTEYEGGPEFRISLLRSEIVFLVKVIDGLLTC